MNPRELETLADTWTSGSAWIYPNKTYDSVDNINQLVDNLLQNCGTPSSIMNTSASSCVTRMCILCGESTGNEHDYICPECKRVWALVKETLKDSVG